MTNTPCLRLSSAQTQASSITLPGSKSISNRVLLLAALAENVCQIHGLLHSDDTDRMREALTALGVDLQEKADGSLQVMGKNAHFKSSADLFLGNAGTAFRSLTAVLSILGGDYHLHGVPRMHERPIGDLIDALRQAGAEVHYLQNTGFPPLKIGRFTPSDVHKITVQGSVSSQFLSALLMALPLAKKPYEIEVKGDLISKPYVNMTLNLLARFGINIQNHQYQSFRLPENAVYHAPETLWVEGDASGASYFFAAGVLGHKPIRVYGVGKNSIQGDIQFVHFLEKMGAKVLWDEHFVEVSSSENHQLPAFDIDAIAIPDAAMTFAVMALAAKGTSVIRNIGSWRVKETDRIAAMACELRKLGAIVETSQDSIQITPPEHLHSGIAIDTYDDHRMAMCFSLVCLLGVDVIIRHPECVNKTFPTYFATFQQILDI
ncbi:MAG: 3-phosphoshikimate 1-carboxyvinyltransferase [Neisseriaceae bacterium]|nr:3-phosphoshikimate 1-carboxyvinyltransferase [Neisseriaceae bacterium]